jgi:hypothetical protein
VTVTTPPRRPEIEQDRDLEERVADLEALIEEARRRARRRRQRNGAAALLIAAAGAAAFIGFGGHGGGGAGTAARAHAPGSQGSAAKARSVSIPPKCSTADTEQRAALRTGAVTRFCGPASAVVRVRGKSFTIRGGHCGKSGRYRWLWFGLINGRPTATRNRVLGAKGLSLVLSPGDRPGRVKVIDGIFQVTGRNLGAFGSATVAKGLKGGTFAVVGSRRPVPEHFTGSWNCG